ncbi:GNAT family N-acetyltransferase [Coralliovum pocilloporae]|uniref:GNAT family N-acetyltransferase n=1 Tax=Coralliovum pocilloporae TaxID=3066369 RepID=UPI0033074C3D
MTLNDISIRLAGASDAEALHDMLLTLADHTGNRHKVTATPESLRKYGFGDRPAFATFFAELYGEPVGFCTFIYRFSTWRGEPGVAVQDIYVSDKVRGLGVGRALLAQVIRFGLADGCTHLRLNVDTENTTARGFYEKLGFTEQPDEHTHMLTDEAFEALIQAG